MSVLDRFSEISSKIYMDGKFYKSQSTESIDVIDPATENKIGEIPETSKSEIDEVVSIANKAQKAWNQKSPLDRSQQEKWENPIRSQWMKFIGVFTIFVFMQRWAGVKQEKL